MSARITGKPYGRASPVLFVHAAHGRGSVLPRRRCHMLRISGFTDDVRFSYHETYRRASPVAAGGMQAAVGRLAH